MMLRPAKIALAALILSALCGRASAQAPNDLKDEKKEWSEYCNAAFEEAKPGPEPHLLTGPKTGYYFNVGNAIASVLADKKSQPYRPTLDLQPISTAQTACNLLGLETNHAFFALVQSDVAHDAWFGHPPEGYAAARGISLVTPLYVEAVHIVVRPHLNLAHLTDLRGRRVWLGNEHSLTVLTAKRILDAAGLTPDQIEALDSCSEGKKCPRLSIRQMTTTQALDALRDLKLDAMFQVGAVPFDTLRDQILPSDGDGHLLDAEQHGRPCDAVRNARLTDPSLTDRELHLFNLDLDLVNRLVADGSYIEQLIPADAYCQQNATLTVGVRALLLTNRKPSDPIVSQLAGAILENQRAIETKLREQVEQQQKEHKDAITGQPYKLVLLRVPAPDTLYVRYHKTIQDKKIYFNPWKGIVRKGVMLGIAMLILFLLLYRFRRIVGPAMVSHGEWPLGLLILLLVWIAASLVLKDYEGSVNEDFNTLPTAMISTFINFFGFGDGPITQKGQQLWYWGRWIFGLIVGGMILPNIRQFFQSEFWARFKNWLLRLGQKPDAPLRPGESAVRHSAPPI
jgi:TRAP transporter TAXI family solute receptor